MAALGLALEIFGPAALVAGIISLLIAAVALRRLPAAANERWLLPAAVAIGYFTGYLALPRSWAALVPQQGQAWQWLPYLGPLAAGCATIFPSQRVVRWFVLAGVAIASGSLLTPTWPIFSLPWPWSIVCLSAYLFCLNSLFHLGLPRFRSHHLLGLLSLAAAITAVGIAAAWSTRLAQLAAIGATALFGCWLPVFLAAKPTEQSSGGIIVVFAVLVGGAAFTACVDPEPPKWLLLLLPALPLLASPFARRKIS
jgi:hypothetical protein